MTGRAEQVETAVAQFWADHAATDSYDQAVRLLIGRMLDQQDAGSETHVEYGALYEYPDGGTDVDWYGSDRDTASDDVNHNRARILSGHSGLKSATLVRRAGALAAWEPVTDPA